LNKIILHFYGQFYKFQNYQYIISIMRKRFQKLFGTYKIQTILIIPYLSYGTLNRIYVKGRVLDNEPLVYGQKHLWWSNVMNAFRQFDTHEISNCSIRLKLGSIEVLTTTDRKGYFLIDAAIPDNSVVSDHEGWVKFELSSPGAAPEIQTAEFEGEYLIPELEADFGIISDIDDTIINTGVTSLLKWKVFRNTIFVNAYHRVPLEGSPALYRKLHLGVNNLEKNPIFYLSNSPWNLYQYLKSFMDHNDFPKGPILLRSFSSIFQKLTAKEKPHKQKEIINLLNAYPDLKFILIGDSGEHDATIYTDIAAQFPNRILCIYLRTVNHKRRMAMVKSIVDNFRIVPVLLVETSEEAEVHARNSGFI